MPRFKKGDTIRVSESALTVAPLADKKGWEGTIDDDAWEIYEPVDDPVGSGYWYTILFSDGSTDYIHEDELEFAAS